MIAGLGKVEQSNDARVVQASHDLNFFENVGALLRTNGIMGEE